MGTTTRSADRPRQEIGLLGWFAMTGFLSMGALYFLDLLIESVAVSPLISLPIGIVAGTGFLLFWLGNDPTVGYAQ